jgi:hypothetical protein
MFVTQAGASIALELVKLCQITDKAEVYDRVAILLQEIIKHQQDYYQLFHSIRWNRSRQKVKAETESKLIAIRLRLPFGIAQCSYEKINLAGQLLNKYADTEQVRDLNSFNRLVQQIQELKMLVEIHHLGEQVTVRRLSGVNLHTRNAP